MPSVQGQLPVPQSDFLSTAFPFPVSCQARPWGESYLSSLHVLRALSVHVMTAAPSKHGPWSKLNLAFCDMVSRVSLSTVDQISTQMHYMKAIGIWMTCRTLARTKQALTRLLALQCTRTRPQCSQCPSSSSRPGLEQKQPQDIKPARSRPISSSLLVSLSHLKLQTIAPQYSLHDL